MKEDKRIELKKALTQCSKCENARCDTTCPTHSVIVNFITRRVWKDED